MRSLAKDGRALVRDGLRSVDRQVSRVSAAHEQPSLISLLFHAVFDRREQLEKSVVLPQERLTREDLVAVVEHFLDTGHTFVSPADVLAGLSETGLYVLLTFDDGYANNLSILDVLGGYEVPVTVSVASTYVAEGKAFWWDVVYRERVRRGSEADVQRELLSVHRQGPAAIERYLEHEFGVSALQPVSDLDRPMTAPELAHLAATPWITIGNHTADHATLPVCDTGEIERQLLRAQDYIERTTGARPDFVSYPHGAYDDQVIAAARRCGLAAGCTIESRKDRLPLGLTEIMSLGRFSVVCGHRLAQELTLCRSDVRMERVVRRLVGR